MAHPISYYLDRYAQGKLTEEERTVLEDLLKDPANEDMLNRVLDGDWSYWETRELDLPAGYERIEKTVLQRIDEEAVVQVPRRIPLPRKWWWAAASVVLFLSIGAYLWMDKKSNHAPSVISSSEILPGKEGAILTLADGSQVVLDSLGNGLIARQNGAQAVIKNGELVYDISGEVTGEVVYNTMSTPKGRQFNLLLPDGTKVWLNAASSIRFPTVFTGEERKVEVAGEIYFEVAKNKVKPFRVDVDGKAIIEVLGTQFNVNAYDNDAAAYTTLLEGTVRVAKNEEQVLLKPGQQAQFASDHQKSAGNAIQVTEDVDIEKVMAWKNGAFNFEDVSLKDAMKQLERWYDIEVVYEKGIPDIHFVGEVSRGITFNQLLIALEKLGVHYKLEGRRLVVLP